METKSAKRTVQDAWSRAEKVQSERNNIYLRMWQRYKGYNPNVTAPYRSNLIMPKLYAAVETVSPRIAKALFGKRPYIPIRSDKNPDGVKPIELALDSYLYKAGFKIKGGQMIKAVALFGTSFIEPIPVRHIITERRTMPSPTYPWQPVEVDVQVPRFRLDIRQYMPWQVYVEPHMVNLESPGYVIIVEITPKSEILRLIESGRYNVDPDEVSAEGDDYDKKFSENMLVALGITRPDDDLDYGVLMRYMSKDRYITAWNGTLVLEETGNPFKHKKINLVRCAWNQDPMLQNSFWGQAEGKACEAILDKLDETWNMTIDNNDIINQAVIGYREEAVEPESIVMAGGARIPIKMGFGGKIRDAIDVIETRGLPPDAYQMPMVFDKEIDRAMGVYAPHRGEPRSGGEQTATETSLLATHGDLRNENRAEMLENIGLADFADKATSHIDQFAAFDDLFEVIGEQALAVATMNPHMVPGGFDYQFKGADSIVNDFQKRADWREILQIAIADPTSRPGAALRKTYELYGYSEQEINDLVLTPEEIAMMMQAQREEEMEAEERELAGDVIRAREGAAAKAKAKGSEKKGVADKKKQKAAKTPTAARPSGTGK